MQISLTYNGLSLCSPSNGIDGYRLKDKIEAQSDCVYYSFPNTKGRLRRRVGIGNTEQSSRNYIFEGNTKFTSYSELESFLEQCEEKNTQDQLGSITYSYFNNSTSFTDDYLTMELKPEKIEGDGKDIIILFWTVKFVKVGY